MGEDLSNGARFAIGMIVISAVVAYVLLVFKVEMRFARQYEQRAGGAIYQSDITQLRSISDSYEYRTGAVVYTVLSTAYKSIDRLDIIIDGTTYHDYEILRDRTNDLFECSYGPDAAAGEALTQDVNFVVFTVKKVGTLNE